MIVDPSGDQFGFSRPGTSLVNASRVICFRPRPFGLIVNSWFRPRTSAWKTIRPVRADTTSHRRRRQRGRRRHECDHDQHWSEFAHCALLSRESVGETRNMSRLLFLAADLLVPTERVER
jgi:hypothetical protein